MVKPPKQYQPQVPEGTKPPAFYVRLGTTAAILDTLSSQGKMFGLARRKKREGREVLDKLYGDVCHYVLHWEKQFDVHEHQLIRIRRGKNFCSVIATVIMESP